MNDASTDAPEPRPTWRPAVLVVEDERSLREGLVSALQRLPCQVLAAAGLTEARAVLTAQSVDCVLLDIRLKDGDGLVFLGELREGGFQDIPVIMATAYGDSERTIRAMRDGAFDYVTKPFHLPTLLDTVQRGLKQRALARQLVPDAPAAFTSAARLIGTSTAMLATWKLIGRAAASSAPVLITGETGVGKELVARAIHDYSTRRTEPFVPVNLAALPPSLMESELFGHEKGAFTGAHQRRLGRFEITGGGTLFLDEIGDLAGALQTKLLRVLQDGTFERVGAQHALHTHARIVTATNQTVHPSDPSSVLREDLYYRLAVIHIHVPPLRERRSDIPLLVANALQHTAARAVSEEGMRWLVEADWPGNVRELIHTLERAAATGGGEVIDVGDLQPAAPPVSSAARSNLGVAEPSERAFTLHEAVAKLEARMIRDALDRASGNRSEAARQLGIARTQLYAKMEEYGMGTTTDR